MKPAVGVLPAVAIAAAGSTAASAPRRSRRMLIWLGLMACALVWYIDANAQRKHQAEVLMHSVANRLSGGQAPTVALERTVAAAHLDLLQPGGVPTTKVLAHSPGFTVIDNLFVWNATMYLVTDTPEELPPLVQINQGFGDRPADYVQEDPHVIQAIASADAVSILGNRATRLRGVSFIWKDSVAKDGTKMLLESLLGSWKIYAHAVAPDGTYNLPFPDRILHPLLSEDDWRDKAGMNSFIIKSAFPAVTAAYRTDWIERADFGFADVYDRVVIFDRKAAQGTLPASRLDAGGSQVMSGSPLVSGVSTLATHPDFWLAVRDSLLQSIPPASSPPPSRPVITYISRQDAAVRRLSTEDHEALVAALHSLEEQFEVHIAELSTMTRHDRIHLAARTEYLIGIHGEALTNLLWLPHRSAVLEILPPKTWSRQFILPSTMVGHRWFGIWNDTVVRDEGLDGQMSSSASEFDVPIVPVNPAPILRIIAELAEDREPPRHLATFPER